MMMLSSLISSCNLDPETWPVPNTVLDFTDCITFAGEGDCVTANAGQDLQQFTNIQIFLDGSGSLVPFAPENLTFVWLQLENGAPRVVLQDPEQINPSFVAPLPGLYEFELETQWFCRSDFDQVSINVNMFTPTGLDAEWITGKSSDTAVQVTFSSPEDPRLFIVYKSGKILIMENGVLLPSPFIDLTPLMSAGSEQGLLGLAFDPDYANNGFFFVDYTGQTPDGTGSFGDTRIAAYQRDPGDPNHADASSHSLLMSISQPESNHNGGQLLFGVDGYLYIGTGDGGGAGDNHGSIGNGQDLQTLLGKILRIQVDGFNPYSIPPDNPFSGTANALEEIWALGLRNPWRFSMDDLTGDLFIADVGQNLWEELNYQPTASNGGENYGWRLKEGLNCYNPSSGCDPGGLTDPILVYAHGGSPFRCSITGGFVYRGQAIAGLNGFYIYGDYCSGQFWTLIKRGSVWENQDLTVFEDGIQLLENITAFGKDSAGELYICTSSGGANIYKITAIH